MGTESNSIRVCFYTSGDDDPAVTANVALGLENAAILFRFRSQQICVMDVGVNLLKIYKLQEAGS